MTGFQQRRRLPPLNALRAFEAAARHQSFKDAAEELAVSQLKGIKLLYWAFILSLVLGVFKMAVYGPPFYSLELPVHLAIPSLNDALAHTRSGDPYQWYINCAVVLVNFIKSMLALSVWGHIIIATCRMAGFQALRNTRSPLRSKTIAEFWNR